MANDDEWVADVKRWVQAGECHAAVTAPAVDRPDDDVALGYEAADPVLQAHHWPDAPTRGR